MSKITIIQYKCDVCENKFDTDKELRTVELPYMESDCEGKTFHPNYRKFDLCKDCQDRYENIVFTHFAEIRDVVGYLSVENKI